MLIGFTLQKKKKNDLKKTQSISSWISFERENRLKKVRIFIFAKFIMDHMKNRREWSKEKKTVGEKNIFFFGLNTKIVRSYNYTDLEFSCLQIEV